jgi:hypothetical protein
LPKYPDYRTEYIQSPQPIGTRKLARRWKIPYKTIADQCRHEGWVEQRKQFQGKVRAESERQAVEALAEARSRWAKEYRTLQAAGLKGLKTLKPKTAGEAARIVDIGIKGERLQREEQSRDEESEALQEIVINWGDNPDAT